MKKKGFAIGHGIGLVVTAGLLATINALALGPFRSTITTYLSGSGLKRASDIGVEGSPYDNASKVVDEIQDESMVLLRNRNNALPLGAANPSEDIKVNVMGYNTVYPFYGGTGSGDSDHENPETYLTAYSSNHIIVNDEYGDAEYIAYVPTRKLGVGPVAMVTTMYVSDVDSADGTRPVVVTDKDFTMIRPVPGLQ